MLVNFFNIIEHVMFAREVVNCLIVRVSFPFAHFGNSIVAVVWVQKLTISRSIQ